MTRDYPLVSIVIPTYNRKEKLNRLLKSIQKIEYPHLEVIVVDDHIQKTNETPKKTIKKLRIIKNKKELYLAGSRNKGITSTIGDYVLLIDDDNLVSPNIIEELLNTFQSKQHSLPIGIVAPITYYLKDPNRIWCAGIKINKITSITKIIGRDKIDTGQYKNPIPSDGFPNAFMVKKEVFKKIGLFNNILFPIHYDEADFGERVKKKYLILCQPKAKIWHDIDLNNASGDKTRALHCHTRLRAYYCGRSRFIFHRIYSKKWQFLLYTLFFNQLITLYYIQLILFNSKATIPKRLNIISGYLKGIMDAIKIR